MILKKLKLRNFRNIDQSEIIFHPHINVFVGENGQGKTNYIESIFFCSTTRSFRTNKDQSMIQVGKTLANIECVIEDEKEIVSSMVVYEQGKSLFIGNKQISKSSEFIGKLNAILFSPHDLELFNGSPKQRRKMMDIEIGKISNKYNNSLNAYLKCLKERNYCLKNSFNEELIEVLEDQMIEYQTQCIKSRKYFIDFINQRISDKYAQLSNDSCDIQCNYLGVIDTNCENYSEVLKEMYLKNREKDILFRVTNSGIHRDDVEFLFNGFALNEVASQGQKRLVLLALKLCLIDFVKETTKKIPILLLDDVLSELDQMNRKRLFQTLDKQVQTIITTTDIDDILKDLDVNPTIFKVSQGTIR